MGDTSTREARRRARDLLRPHEPGVIWMLTIYAKNVAEIIPVQLLRRIRKEIEDA